MPNMRDKVLICNQSWENEVLNGTFKPEYGTVVGMYRPDDRTYHGNQLYDAVLEVRGDDGRMYNDDITYFTSKRFFTKEEFANELKFKIMEKEQDFMKINNELSILKSQLKQFEPDKNVIGYGTHGSCGWTVDNQGTLTISPLNGMYGLLKNQNELRPTSPWQHLNHAITKVVVEKGVEANNDVSGLFAYLRNCKEMDLSGLDTIGTINMSYMFAECGSLQKLDISNFDLGCVSDTSRMFDNCQSLKSLNMGKFYAPSLSHVDFMFNGCNNLNDRRELEESIHRQVLPSKGFSSQSIPENGIKAWTPPKVKDHIKDMSFDNIDK